MPIIDVELVCDEDESVPTVSAQALADAAAAVFGSPPGRTWVRLRRLPATAYAENGVRLAPANRPVFVTVLKAHPPTGDALAMEVTALTDAIAAETRRPSTEVHITYSAPAAGRQAFGGRVVT